MPINSWSDPPVRCALAITSDTDDYGVFPIRGVSFGTAGTLKVTTVDGDTVTIPSGAMAAGRIHPMRIKRLYTTGTTAAGVVFWG